MSRYGHIDRDALERRLAAAEDLCVMYSWSPADHETEPQKAAHELWLRWHNLPGVSTDPSDHPELASAQAALARQRDATRASTLTRLFGPDERTTP